MVRTKRAKVMKAQKKVQIKKVEKLSQAYKLEKPVSALEAGKRSAKAEESMTLTEAHAKVLKTAKSHNPSGQFLGVPQEALKAGLSKDRSKLHSKKGK